MNFNLAHAYVQAVAGDPSVAIMDWRCLSDRDPGADGHARRGTLGQWWPWLCEMNAQGYGCFITPSLMDGFGRSLPNVTAIRAHYIDLDAADAQQQYELATQASPAPSFAVQSSPGKWHVYWVVAPYAGNERFTVVQRKLMTVFHGDPKVIDPTRVMRLPGTMHCKGAEPHLVTCWGLAGLGTPTTVEALETALQHVTAAEGGNGERKPLGAPEQAASSLEWLQRALDLTDPNDLDRTEWIAFTSGWKQAGWTLAPDETLFAMWSHWCARYEGNDPKDNAKQWKSIRDTELGWKSIVRRTPSLQPLLSFGGVQHQAIAAPAIPMPEPKPLDCSGPYLTHLECAEYFKGCTFVISLGQMLGPDRQFYNANSFNGAFGGKKFIIDEEGKKTDEPWKAATRSTLWTVPKVNHTRFLPQHPTGAILTDDLGRTGVNMYVAPIVRKVKGDPSPFLNHLAAILPVESDRKILLDWMAHTIKYPGWKIPWAPVIQSTEGIGKNVIKHTMTHCIGQSYVHCPEAQQLAESGGKFNAWMRNRVFILADEINVDEKRHMIEVLKPLISERLIEVQAKGVDQKMEDNVANWMFFTNYKTAVPLSKNGRRYAMFFSQLQTEAHILAMGMGDEYMKAIFAWLDADGMAIMAQWFDEYPIARGDILMRAPKTSSWAEAVAIGRSPIERVVQEAVEDGLPGFRGGWVSSIAAIERCKALGAVRANVTAQTLNTVLEGMGYVEIGRAGRAWMQEDHKQRTSLFYRGVGIPDVSRYGIDQGYE